VRMLRRAMDLGGFHQVIFICHSPTVWELADCIVSVGGGRVMMGDQKRLLLNPPVGSPFAAHRKCLISPWGSCTEILAA
jgi:hypothetical protein